MDQSRRAFVLRGGYALAIAAAPAGRSAHSDATLPFAEIEMGLGGRIGVAAVDTGTGARQVHRGDERFAMCSTFKWMLAAAVLARHDRGSADLGQRLSYSAMDLLAHSPVTEQHLAAGALPIGELCKAVVETSDNTAANILLKFIGGPAALTHYLRTIGDDTTRLDRIEPALNTNEPGDPRDTSTPNAMIATMHAILVGNALATASRERLVGWMKNCQTGLQRLRGGLPPNWAVGDKTGTGDHGAVNDIAIAWPPQRPPLLIVSYMSGSSASLQTLEAAHARIAELVAAALS